jgi:hypothetical protein
MLVVLLPPLRNLRLPKVYEGMLNFLYRIRRGNDTEMVISVAIFPANMKLRRRLPRLNIQMYLHISSTLKNKKIHYRKTANCPKLRQLFTNWGDTDEVKDSNLPYFDITPLEKWIVKQQ